MPAWREYGTYIVVGFYAGAGGRMAELRNEADPSDEANVAVTKLRSTGLLRLIPTLEALRIPPPPRRRTRFIELYSRSTAVECPAVLSTGLQLRFGHGSCAGLRLRK